MSDVSNGPHVGNSNARSADVPVGNGAAKPRKVPLTISVKPAAVQPVTLTVLTKDGRKPFTKQIALAADGLSLVNDKSACKFAYGTADRVTVDGVAGLGTLIEGLTQSQGLTLGALRDGLSDKVRVTVKDALRHGTPHPDLIARSADNLVYRGPAFTLFDFDTKGMPPNVAAELARLGGFWPALMMVLPALNGVAYLIRSSTSAGLSRSDTGAAIKGSDGVHIFIVIMDGTDAERFLRALHARCWLAGLGWYALGASGQLLERSIVDRMVGGGERPVFEAAPVLVPPLVQDMTCRKPIAVDGTYSLDTVAVCPPLTLVEQSRFNELRAKDRARLAPEEAKARDKFITVKAKELRARNPGMSEAKARATVTRWNEGVLWPVVVLPFDDEDLVGKTVADVLADPARYVGETLSDPLEGPDYGRCVAKIMRHADGSPWIHSFAHGRTIYELKYDANSVTKLIDAADPQEVVGLFTALATKADLDAVEISVLVHAVAKRADVGVRAVQAAMKAALGKAHAALAATARERRLAERTDPRPLQDAPLPDEEWLPVMGAVNTVATTVDLEHRPRRDIDGTITHERRMPIGETHAFTNANEEETTDDQPTNS